MLSRLCILLAICAFLCSLCSAQDRKTQDLVQVRYIEPSFHQGTIRMKDNRKPHRTLYLSGQQLFCLRDVDSAHANSGYSSNGKRFYDVIIRFKRAFRDSMYHITSRHLYGRIAIIVDGQLETPQIMNPFREPLISVMKSSDSEAKDLARRINGAVKNQ